MNILTRTVLGGLFLAALAAGCGSPDNTDTVSNRETMKLPDAKKPPGGKDLPKPPPPPVPP